MVLCLLTVFDVFVFVFDVLITLYLVRLMCLTTVFDDCV